MQTSTRSAKKVAKSVTTLDDITVQIVHLQRMQISTTAS